MKRIIFILTLVLLASCHKSECKAISQELDTANADIQELEQDTTISNYEYKRGKLMEHKTNLSLEYYEYRCNNFGFKK